MKWIQGLVFTFLVLISVISCSKSEQNSPQSDVSVDNVSQVAIPEFKDPELQLFAKDYDLYINKAMVKYKTGEADSEFQVELDEDYKIYEDKMKTALANASARDQAIFKKYLNQKKQELKELVEKK